MTWPRLTVAAVCVVVGLASPSLAGQVKLEIRGGLVTLDARDATLREILAEWARVGQTQVMNAERVPGGPMTVQLAGVPERQALETLLRSVAGFLAAARAIPLDAASIYDRIMLMPAARPAGVTAPTAGASSGPPQPPWARDRSVPTPVTVADDEDEPAQAPPQVMPIGPAGAQQPGVATAPAPFNPYGAPGNQAAPTNPTLQRADQATMPGAASRPGMPTAPIKPPDQSGVIK
jgi:hypothetical protein